MAVVFHQDSDESEDVTFAVIDDPKWRWIGKVRIGFPVNGGYQFMCRSYHPVRDNGFHMDVIVPAISIDVIGDTTVEDIIMEWSGYSGRN